MEKSPALKAVADVEVPVVVRLAETTLNLGEILALRPGSTLSFPQGVDEPLKLEVDGATVGEGYAVERQGALGFRIQRLAAAPPSAGEPPSP